MKFALFVFLFVLTFSAWSQALLSDGIPHPYYAKQDQGENEVMSINDGMAALQLRLEMIRRAEKTIEVEYFIFNADLAGKIILRELVRAAERGVKVRILIDKSKPIFVFNEYYVKAISKYGIEVRYYNKAPLVRISTVQFRNHRKLITIDDKEAMTGGRNIGDDYFDLSDHFNFHDTDIYVRGPIVKIMRESFDAYFEHKISERIKLPEETNKNFEEKTAEASAFLEETPEETAAR